MKIVTFYLYPALRTITKHTVIYFTEALVELKIECFPYIYIPFKMAISQQ